MAGDAAQPEPTDGGQSLDRADPPPPSTILNLAFSCRRFESHKRLWAGQREAVNIRHAAVTSGPFRSWRDRSGLSDEAWQAVKRDHARLIRAAGAERFVLDRLCLEDDAPLSSEVGRVKGALERVAGNGHLRPVEMVSASPRGNA